MKLNNVETRSKKTSLIWFDPVQGGLDLVQVREFGRNRGLKQKKTALTAVIDDH